MLKFRIGLSVSIISLLISLIGCDINSQLNAETKSQDPGYVQKRNYINNKLSKSDEPLVLIVKNDKDEASIEITKNIIWTLIYTKITYRTFDVITNNDQFEIPTSTHIICLSVSDLGNISTKSLKKIIGFVAAGNLLIVVQPVWDQRIEPLVGIKPDAMGKMDTTAKGIYFNKKVLPGLQYKRLKPEMGSIHNGYHKNEFENGLDKILSASSDTTYPVLIEKKIGMGYVDYYNTYILTGKRFRGIIFSNIIKGLQDIPYPTANVSSIFLDDFPQPLYNYKSPPIDKEYDLTDANFVSKVWWRDMSALADSMNLKYTGMLVFNYNNEITPPFDFKQWTHGKIDINNRAMDASLWLLNEAKKEGLELGFHGYNHVSLLLNNWSDERYMKAAIETAKKRWKIDNIGPLPVTYVPPNDYIDSVGIQSLVKGMPSIRYLCSLYLDEVPKGNGREFDLDPYSNWLFDYPRISDGYVDNVISIFNQQSLYIYTGIWNHFIHPDDVYDLPSLGGEGNFDPRNIHSLGWHKYADKKVGLYEVFKKRLIETKRNNPLIRYETVSEAVPKVINWRSSLVERRFEDSTVTLIHLNLSSEQDTGKIYWYVYVPRKDVTILEKAIRKQSDTLASVPLWNGYLFQFASRSKYLTLPLYSGKIMKSGKRQNAIIKKAIDRYEQDLHDTPSVTVYNDSLQSYHRLQKALLTFKKHPDSHIVQNDVIKLAEASNRLTYAKNILKDRIVYFPPWYKDDVDHLLNLYSWQDSSMVIWDIIEERWDKYHDIETLQLYDYVTQKMGNPPGMWADIWSRRALSLQPDNDKYKIAFIRLHQKKDDWPETKKLLLGLIKVHPDSDTLYYYTLRRSVWYDKPKQIFNLLQQFPEKSYQQLIPLARNIANVYVYNSHNVKQGDYWAEFANKFDHRTILQKLLDEKRYRDFNYYSWKYLENDRNNESLRTYIGRAYLDQGELNTGLRILYPLFKNNKVNDDIVKRVRTEMTYLSDTLRLKILEKYPDLFNQNVQKQIRYRHRIENGLAPTFSSTFANDNFDNTIGKIGFSSTWNRKNLKQQINVKYYYVDNEVRRNTIHSNITGLKYHLGNKSRNSRFTYMAGAGIVFNDQMILPDVSFTAATNRTIFFTTLQINYQPLFVNPALSRKFRIFKTQIYNEVPLLNQKLLYAQSIIGNWFSDNNVSFEWLGKVYLSLAKNRHYNFKPLVMLSYADAQNEHRRGNPYWTPHNLSITGAGIFFDYQKDNLIPFFNFNTEIMIKNDNESGIFFTTNFNLETLIAKYWRLNIKSEMSTSNVYRYNLYGFSISHYFHTK